MACWPCCMEELERDSRDAEPAPMAEPDICPAWLAITGGRSLFGGLRPEFGAVRDVIDAPDSIPLGGAVCVPDDPLLIDTVIDREEAFA